MKKLFFGLAAMLCCSSIQSRLLLDIKDTLILTTGGSDWTTLKLAVMLSTLVIGAILILLSQNGKVDRVFKAFFPLNALLLFALTLLTYIDSAPFSNSYCTHVFYVWVTLSATLSAVLIWGLVTAR